MDKNTKSSEQKIAKLRSEYEERLLYRFAELNKVHSELLEAKDKTVQIEELQELSHTLCGSAGTFGFGEVAAICKRIEDFCKILKKRDDNIDAINEISRALDLLEESVITPKITDQTVLMDFNPFKTKTYTKKLIYILDDDKDFGESLKLRIEKYGYKVKHFIKLDNFFDAIESEVPEAIIIDIVLNNDSGTDALQFLYDQLPFKIPSIVISSSNDFESRLKTVRARADAFLAKPFDTPAIIEAIEILISDQYKEPYRIMIVDDVEVMSSYYSIVLERAGMVCMTISDPTEIMQALSVFDPDLIVMDLHMPVCRGDELAKLIHQEKMYVSLPIIYLSSEANVSEQAAALQLAGDDFLTKPVRPSHLVGSISVRAKRYRMIKSAMEKDSLTGLLNYSSLKATLDRECSRSSRSHIGFCFAIVDMDHFKDINEKYGYACGDMVLKNLAWLLKQRLRKTDVVGRYGGQEFGIIMPETDLAAAEVIMNELRMAFHHLEMKVKSELLKLTFSTGIAAYPEFKRMDDICRAADKFLYDAKFAGRDRVIAGTLYEKVQAKV